MSERDVVLFLEKLTRDQALRTRAATIPESDVAGIVALAHAQGCSFTEQEWRDARERRPEVLTDELERVAGGLWSFRSDEETSLADQSGMAIEKIELAVEKVERG